jgi:hypothetical protein
VQRGFDLSLQLRLVVLDEQQVIAAAIADSLGYIPVREHGIAADQFALHGQDAQQTQGGLVFVGFGIDAELPQHGGVVGGEGGQQVDTGNFAVAAALERLAVQGYRLDRRRASLHPDTQDGLEGLQVDGSEDLGKGGLGGRLFASESQSEGESGAVVASELGDGLQALHASEHGEDGEGENGGQGMDTAAGFAGFRDGSEEFDERRASHRDTSSGRCFHAGGHT